MSLKNLKLIKIRFVIDLSEGCAAQNSCHPLTCLRNLYMLELVYQR